MLYNSIFAQQKSSVFSNEKKSNSNLSLSSPQKNEFTNNAHKIIFDQYFLIYGIKISSELYQDMIDFVVESGEWEGELMEFIGDDDWYIFEIEGRGKPERYDYLEGFLEENLGFQSIFNAKGENTLYVGKIVWSTTRINVDDNNCVNNDNTLLTTLLDPDEEMEIIHEAKELKQKLKEKNEYWSDNLAHAGYYWIRGTESC
jgi:hypothetical protein